MCQEPRVVAEQQRAAESSVLQLSAQWASCCEEFIHMHLLQEKIHIPAVDITSV